MKKIGFQKFQSYKENPFLLFGPKMLPKLFKKIFCNRIGSFPRLFSIPLIQHGQRTISAERDREVFQYGISDWYDDAVQFEFTLEFINWWRHPEVKLEFSEVHPWGKKSSIYREILSEGVKLLGQAFKDEEKKGKDVNSEKLNLLHETIKEKIENL